MKQTFRCLAIALTLVFLYSCSNDDKPEEKGIAVKSVKAFTTVDLSDRSDWIFKVNYNEYNHTSNDRNINATVKDNLSHFHSAYPEGSKVKKGQGPTIQLISPDYYPKTKDVGPPTPNISDQSSAEKFLVADVLSCYYEGLVSEDLTEVPLTHANALLEFEIVGAPDYAEVSVFSLMTIKPYRISDSYGPFAYGYTNKYKAIVLAEGGEFSALVAVKIGNEVYQTTSLSGGSYMKRDTRYKFSVRFDEAKKTLSIEDLIKSTWSEDDNLIECTL